MSSRALKRLEKRKQYAERVEHEDDGKKNNFHETDSRRGTATDDLDTEREQGSHSSEEVVPNRFFLLCDETHDSSSTLTNELAASSESETNNKEMARVPTNDAKITTSGKKKNRRRRKKQTQEDDERSIEEILDDMEFLPTPATQMSGFTTDLHGACITGEPPTHSNAKSIFRIEHKYLDTDIELTRIFGARVVQADNTNRRQRKLTCKMVKPKTTWPALTKSGLTMCHKATEGMNLYFTFEHNQNYQKVEHQFLDAVESMNPQDIMNIMKTHPYHVNTLLQLSDLSRLSEDMSTAADLIERALFVQENAFHSRFSLTTGQSRLDYRYPENRAFMMTIFRHIIFVGLKGCYRTALEFCKLLLSLNDADPLGVLLMMDFYALLSHEYTYLVTFYRQLQASKNLSQLPNFAFSVPLALFKRSTIKKSRSARSQEVNHADEARLHEADSMLQDSLLMFPQMLSPLLEQCSIKADDRTRNHVFFSECLSDKNEPASLRELCNLYSGRCSSCWKEQAVLTWLEKNVSLVTDLVDKGDNRVLMYREKRQLRYRSAPLNVYRHFLVSDVKGVTVSLPPELAARNIRNYDPLPPADSITTYTHTPRLTRLQQDNRFFTTFLRSLLPNFVPTEPATEGAEAVDGASVRDVLQTLMTAMRDLLHNIQPVAPPVENDNGDPERDDAEWE